MRPAFIAVAIAAVTFVLAACASPEDAAWTYAPPPTEVAASGEPASVEPSAAPASVAPSTAPASVQPSAPASAPASGAPSGAKVTVTAANIQWDQADLTVPAATPFTLEIVNQDASVPHNIDILDSAGKSLFTTDTFPGVETREFQAPALPAGQYQFMCTVHPTMLIEVTAQ